MALSNWVLAFVNLPLLQLYKSIIVGRCTSYTECLLWADCVFVFMNVCHFKCFKKKQSTRVLRLAESVFLSDEAVQSSMALILSVPLGCCKQLKCLLSFCWSLASVTSGWPKGEKAHPFLILSASHVHLYALSVTPSARFNTYKSDSMYHQWPFTLKACSTLQDSEENSYGKWSVPVATSKSDPFFSETYLSCC